MAFNNRPLHAHPLLNGGSSIDVSELEFQLLGACVISARQTMEHVAVNDILSFNEIDSEGKPTERYIRKRVTYVFDVVCDDDSKAFIACIVPID